MDIYFFYYIIYFLAMPFVALVYFLFGNYLSNNFSDEVRSKELRNIAKDLHLQYFEEEKRSWWQKITLAKKKVNIIKGDYLGRDILIFEYCVLPFVGNYYAQAPDRYTHINKKTCLKNISVKELEDIIKQQRKIEEVSVFKSNRVSPFLIFLVLLCYWFLGMLIIQSFSVSIKKEAANTIFSISALILFVIGFCYNRFTDYMTISNKKYRF